MPLTTRQRVALLTADERADLLRRFHLYAEDQDPRHLTYQEAELLIEIAQDEPLPTDPPKFVIRCFSCGRTAWVHRSELCAECYELERPVTMVVAL